LFTYVLLTETEALQAYERLTQQGIFVRLFRQLWALRFGLPDLNLTSASLLNRCLRLQGLRPPNFAAIGSDGAIQRHILRLKWHDS
jgi:hypothetical protein